MIPIEYRNPTAKAAAAKFHAVQAAANARRIPDTQTLARQIVAASQGDMRVAYDFLDTLNAHVTRMLMEKKNG